jgi:hypothetical protein
MTITEVRSNTFLSDTVNIIRDKLSSNITDPISGKRPSSEKFILTSYPKRAVTYPLITIMDRGITQPRRLGMGSEGTTIVLTVEIRIWARNVKERDELFDSVYSYLRNSQLDSDGLVNANLSGFSLSSAINISDEEVQSKVMEVNFLIICS